MNKEEYIEREKKIMDMEYSIITDYIKIRKNSKISQEELAKETNVIRTTIARIENNMNSPQLKTMLELLEPLGYTLKIVPLKNKNYWNVLQDCIKYDTIFLSRKIKGEYYE